MKKNHGITSIKQNEWLEKYINFNTQKRIKAKKRFYGKIMENLRNRLRLEFIKKYDYKKITKQESKLTFNGIHKSYENCDSYLFQQKEVPMDEPIFWDLQY